MKILKRISFVLIVVLVISSVSGYYYFEKKFAPPQNYLDLKGSTGDIGIAWESNEFSPVAALLLPVRIEGIDTPFYMQLDFGSPVTMLYSGSLKSIHERYPAQLQFADTLSALKTDFDLGNMHVSSDKFKVIKYGEPVDWNDTTARNIIGTIGTDMLEKRVAVLDFENNICSFPESFTPDNKHPLTGFEFKKRRVLLPASIDDKDVQLLFDTGTSAFELVTSKDSWQKYADPDSKAKVSTANSWGNSLKTYTTKSRKEISFGHARVKLNEVTYIEGTSFLQNVLMRLSGMDGMIGNKLFMHKTIILDCRNEKFTIY